MIVVVLIVIWGIALIPVTMRWLSEREFTSSVARFMMARRSLRQTYPLLTVVGAERVGSRSIDRHRTSPRDEEVRRVRRERAQLRIERRRRALGYLASATAFTVVFGALPPMHVLWDFSLVGLVLIASYVALLARIAQQEAAAAGRRRKVVPMATRRRYEASAPLLVANGQFRDAVPRLARRPAFVLVDAPS